MITALVQFKLPQPVTREKAQEIFVGTASKYRERPASFASTTSSPRTAEQRAGSTCGNRRKTPRVSTLKSGETTSVKSTGHHHQ